MLTITYSGRSKPSALKIAEASEGRIRAVRSSEGDVSWGRANARTKLNADISNTTNKRVMRELFQEHDVPMPRLIDPRYLLHAMWNGDKVVGRPDQHTKGRGFWLIDKASKIQRALRGTKKKKAATHFMEYIDADREYRVHIFNGKSIRISEKGFTDGSKEEYITRKPTHDVRQVRKAAKQAVASVGLDFGAVDILARGDDNSEVFVLEVNAAPGLGGSMPKLYAATFLKWAEDRG